MATGGVTHHIKGTVSVPEQEHQWISTELQ